MKSRSVKSPINKSETQNKKLQQVVKKTFQTETTQTETVKTQTKMGPASGVNLYIASMKMRGEWAKRPADSHVLNVTSMQGKTRQERFDYSPMHILSRSTETQHNKTSDADTRDDDDKNKAAAANTATGYKGFACFENYWQSGKRWKQLRHHIDAVEHAKSVQKWKKLDKCKRRDPKTKGMTVYDAVFNGIPMDYVTSRKQVYVPEYYSYMLAREKTLQKYKTMLDEGKTVVVYDFDGPREKEGKVSIEKVSLELLQRKINDTAFPFGHGYVVAATLFGLKPNQYTQ